MYVIPAALQNGTAAFDAIPLSLSLFLGWAFVLRKSKAYLASKNLAEADGNRVGTDVQIFLLFKKK